MAHKLTLIAHTVVLICLLPLLLQSSYSFSALVSVSSSSSFNPPNSLFSSTSARALAQNQSYKCYPPDLEALQEVAASSPAPDHTVFGDGLRLLWKPEQDCCSWTGVTCGGPLITYSSNRSATTKYFRVVRLMLADIYSGEASTASKLTFPFAICCLSALTSLDLSFNQLMGPIPTCLSHNLTSLKTLNLSSNQFSGLITPLANLSLLTHLELSYNALSGSLSPLKLHMPRLQYLDLSSNALSGSLSPLKLHMPRLQYLDLSHNALSGSLSPLKLHMPRLQYLDLRTNALSGSLSPLKLHMPRLQYLDLSNNALSGSLSPLKVHMPRLQYLDLSANALSGSISFIDGLSDLRVLDLSEISLNISLSSPAFSSTPRLRELYLFDVLQTTGDIRSLEHLQHLETLGLTMAVPDGSLRSLFCKLQSLREVYVLGYTYADSYPEDAATINGVLNDKLCEKQAPVNLTTLRLVAQGYKGPFPTWFGDSTQLEALDLSFNRFEGSIPHEWQALTHLVELALSGNSPRPLFLSDEVPSWLFRLPLAILYLDSTGLTSQDFPCAGFSLLNQTLFSLSLSNNHISHGHSLMHCLQHHNFSHLNLLDLSSNMLTGLVPSFICSIRNAVILDNNHLHGELVSNSGLKAGMVSIANNYLSKAFFENVSHLEVLDLSNNQLHGSLESLLGDYSVMRDLTALNLYGNQLSGSIPISLGTSAPSLIAMDLSNNQLTGAIPHTLQHLQALLSKGPAGRAKFSYTLKSVKNVKFIVEIFFRGHLDFSCNQLNGVIPDGLGALVGLNDLNLSGNQLSGPIPRSLARLSSLESLDLSFNKLQGAIPSDFLALHELAVFNVSFNPELSGQIPEGPQLETATSYKGDDKLCGQAINKDCGDQQAETPSVDVKPDAQEFGTNKSFFSVVKLWIEEWAAIPAIFIGYALGVGVTIWGLKLLHFYK